NCAASKPSKRAHSIGERRDRCTVGIFLDARRHCELAVALYEEIATALTRRFHPSHTRCIASTGPKALLIDPAQCANPLAGPRITRPWTLLAITAQTRRLTVLIGRANAAGPCSAALALLSATVTRLHFGYSAARRAASSNGLLRSSTRCWPTRHQKLPS